MTPVSCSPQYSILSQTLGYQCSETTQDADSVAELAYVHQALICPENMITCLSGHCRQNIQDCPQYVMCPSDTPVMCQDGQCVTQKTDCDLADISVASARETCQSQGLLLCDSDLKTCVSAIENCPTLSTCPFGYTKCAEN